LSVKKEYYVASKEIKDFTKATSFIPSLYSLFDRNNHLGVSSKMRNTIVKKIGERGVAKFGVALTFINDLHNLNNWGYDSKGLVIIDVDSMIDSSDIINFFDSAIGNLRAHSQWMGMDFSFNNIKQMKLIYEKMKNTSVPKVHDDVDMSNEMYLRLLDCYKDACELALEKIKIDMPEIRHSKPSSKINKILINSFKETILKYDDSYMRRIKNFIL